MIVPPDFLSHLRSRGLLRDVIGEHTTLVPLHAGASSWFTAPCPFCSGGKTGKCTIRVRHMGDGGDYYDSSLCRAHGDSLGAAMRLKNLSKDDAVKYLAERLGIPVPEGLEPVTEVSETAQDATF